MSERELVRRGIRVEIGFVVGHVVSPSLGMTQVNTVKPDTVWA